MPHEQRQDEDEPEQQGGSPTLIGPFLSPDPYGAGFVIPGPLTAGPPQPEPEERWTLGPGRHEADADGDESPAAEEPSGWRTRLRRLLGLRRS